MCLSLNGNGYIEMSNIDLDGAKILMILLDLPYQWVYPEDPLTIRKDY